MIDQRLCGVLTASVTPANRDGSIDTVSMGRLMKYYAESGIKGVLLPSSTGSSFSLTLADRVKLVSDAAKANPSGLTILANCSEHNIVSSVADAKAMADAGADFAVCMPPQFLTFSQDELCRFFFEIADHSPIPLIVYTHLTRMANKVSEDLMRQLSAHGNIAGIKDTHNDPGRMLRIASSGLNESFAVLCGGDGVAAFAALLGMEMLNALSAVKPKLFTNLYAAGRAGNWKLAGYYQTQADHLMNLFTALRGGLSSSTLFSQAIMAALSLKGLCGTANVMLGYDMLEEDYENIRRILDEVRDEPPLEQ